MGKKIIKVMPVALLLLLAFLIGFIAPGVGASRGNITSFTALLPDSIQDAIGASDNSGIELPVVETYYDVLNRLQDDYYTSAKVDDRQLTYSAIRGMLTVLEDPYTRFLDPDSYNQMREENEGNFVGIGAQLAVDKSQHVFIKEPLPDSPAYKAGVKTGDVIIKVDGKAVAGMDVDKVVERIRGEEGTRVKLTLLRGNAKTPVEISITRRLVEYQMVRYNMVDKKNKIGYIRLYQFNGQSDSQFETAITALEKQKINGLIFDLRQNPGGLLKVAVDIGSRFVDSGPIVIIQERSGHKESLNVEPEKHNHKKYPLVVLVDQNSASASEIVSGAIQDNHAGTLVGTRTYGKARVQTVTPLADGSALSITTAKYLTPNGADINKVGVKPDVFVAGSENIEIGDLKQDVQLNKALSIMKEKLHTKGGKPSSDRK